MKDRVNNMLNEVSKVISNLPEITHLGNPILRTTCIEVDYATGVNTSKKLIEILRKYRDLVGIGAGLAAPQIGLSHKVFVTYDRKLDMYEAFINPEIIESSKSFNYYRESCLSSRMFWSDTKRPDTITMTYTDMEGDTHTEKFDSFKARLLQHEYDHLIGIPCLDKAIPGTIEYSGDVKKELLRDTPVNS